MAAASPSAAVQVALADPEAPAEQPSSDAELRGAAPATQAPIEVIVSGERQTLPVRSKLERAEVRQLPGAFGDPFRALDVLPGVTPIVSGLPYYYVRGAPPSSAGYFVDGVRVPYLHHFALGPSVLNPALVERIELYPGGFPAAFGRYTGAIVAVETIEPRSEAFGEGLATYALLRRSVSIAHGSTAADSCRIAAPPAVQRSGRDFLAR